MPSALKPQATERVIGGHAAAAGAYPATVSLEVVNSEGVGLCGGTLINNHTIVTAAHCVFDFDTNTVIPATNMHVGYGSNSRKNQTVVPVKAVHMDPAFNPLQTENDIAILTIDPITTTASVQPAPIYSGTLPTGTNLTAVGWGLTAPGGSFDTLPDELQATRIVVGTRDECRKMVPAYESSSGPQICTQNSLAPGSDTCQGDSGTGVFITIDGQNYLAGLTSFGASPDGDPTCALSDGLAIYTHVYYYMPFISQYAGTTATGPRRHRHDHRYRPGHGHWRRPHGHRASSAGAPAHRPVDRAT